MPRSPRKEWDELSPDYRRRLERFGITRETHATAPLYQARGHFPRDETAGRELGNRPGVLGIRSGRRSYREASREWERVRGQLRGLPSPLRPIMRQAILIEREFDSRLSDDVLSIYRNAKDSFEANPDSGNRRDIADRMEADLFELQVQFYYFDYDWVDELDVWYH